MGGGFAHVYLSNSVLGWIAVGIGGILVFAEGFGVRV